MKTLNGLPVFKMMPGKGIDFTSFVTDPAIEVLYKTFSGAVKEIYKFNKDKQIVTGPVMIPDLPIYRYDKTHGEYYVVFDKATIAQLHEIAMNEKKTLSFNYQHQNNSQVVGAVLIESWFIAEGDNKAKAIGFDLPVGTLMYSVKINNKEFWDNEIKSGNVKGFSIEGYLDMVALSKLNKKFMEGKTKDGLTIKSVDETLVEGSVITLTDSTGALVAVKEGEYTLENGTVLTVDATGKVLTVVEATQDEEVTEEEQAAMKKIFDKIFGAEITALKTEIETLKTKLSQMPGATSATDKDDKENTPKQSHGKSAMAKITSYKESLKKK